MTLDRSCRSKVIHCILPPGRASGLIERLREEQGIACMFSHHARGGGLSTRRGESFHYRECDVVTLLAPLERADEVFEFVYRAAGVDQPHSGMVLMESCLLAGLSMSLEDHEGTPG